MNAVQREAHRVEVVTALVAVIRHYGTSFHGDMDARHGGEPPEGMSRNEVNDLLTAAVINLGVDCSAVALQVLRHDGLIPA